MKKKEIVHIFDLDGTLADETHRSHLRMQNKWDEYHDRIPGDTPFPYAIEHLNRVFEKGDEIYFLTGRSERNREITISWLERYSRLKREDIDNSLIMRSNNDWRPFYIVKNHLLSKITDNLKDKTVICYDDMEENGKLFMSLGFRFIPAKRLIDGILREDIKNDYKYGIMGEAE